MKVDPKEFELPETHFIRDIENNVFQEIVAECLAKIDGIEVADGTFMESLFGKGPGDRLKSIHAEQESRTHSVSIKIEVSVRYGVSIPNKADEIQSKVTEAVTRLTGLHVSSVHVVFKSLIHRNKEMSLMGSPVKHAEQLSEDYSDEF